MAPRSNFDFVLLYFLEGRNRICKIMESLPAKPVLSQTWLIGIRDVTHSEMINRAKFDICTPGSVAAVKTDRHTDRIVLY